MLHADEKVKVRSEDKNGNSPGTMFETSIEKKETFESRFKGKKLEGNEEGACEGEYSW